MATTTEATSKPKRQWLWIGLSIVILIATLSLLWDVEDTAEVVQADKPLPAQIVSIVNVEPSEAIASIAGFGELRARWDAQIRAAVSGRITMVHNAALAGERVVVDTPLFDIEKTQYLTAVAAAELSLEEAKLSRWRAENAVALARREFERTGAEPPNELALRLPELRIAERAVAAAVAQLTAARQQLTDTEVVAPFSGFVTQRMASLGQTVSTGEPLIHLSDDRQYELVIELSQADWALLDHPVAGRSAKLFHRDGSLLGQARIRQGGGFLDPQTRQRRLFLDVIDPADSVLAGDFVKVVLTGRSIANTLTIPESALTRAGHVWLVDTENLLVRIEPDILFRSDNALTIAAPNKGEVHQVAITPLASFLPGQRVAPQLVEG